MNKNILTIFIILLTIMVGGSFFWVLYSKDARQSLPEKETIAWERQTEGIYRNKKHGFQLIMPSTWNNYATKEEKDNQTTIISFGLPLETNEISQWLREPEKTEKIFKIWSLHIIPIFEYELQKRECEGSAINYPCFYPEEIARNEKQVFASGQHFIAGGWDPCSMEEIKNKEPYFCSVYMNMISGHGYSIEESFSLLEKIK